jgi:type I restriction enzyme S subunit
MNWPRVSLKDLSALGPQYGANLKAVAPSGRGLRYIRITDIDEFGRLRPDTLVEPESVDIAEYFLTEGDLLLARSGATVGKTYRYTSADGQCAFAGYLIRFRPNSCVASSPFLSYYFQTPEYWAWVQGKKRIAAQPNINGAEYAALEIPLPSLQEQSRIVELLDEADRLRRLSREASAKAERILLVLFLRNVRRPGNQSQGLGCKTAF